MRLSSLDLLRGLTVALMILVNNGAGPEIYPQLVHSAWNGLTACDLVFPFFLFIMGMSTYLSLHKTGFRWSEGVVRKVVRRTLLIFFIGLAINWLDMACSGRPFDFAHLRFWAVMQRIAVCYFLCSVIVLSVPHRAVPAIIVALLAGYGWLIVAGNGYSTDPDLNILSRADRAIFGYDHLYHKSAVDPEGLLGTISATAHTLLGFYCARMMQRKPDLKHKMFRLITIGMVLTAVGFVVAIWLPINKRIWSPSYVLVTCGLASLLQAALIYVVDMQRMHRADLTFRPTWAEQVFLAFGCNPLFLYLLSEVLAIIFGAVGVKDAAFGAIHSVVSSGYMASLIYALLFVGIHVAVALPLWKHRVFIKL